MAQERQHAHARFQEALEAAGWEVEHYRGRFYWEGPAVRVADGGELQQVIKVSPVEVQWDNLGLGYIVYPKAYK